MKSKLSLGRCFCFCFGTKISDPLFDYSNIYAAMLNLLLTSSQCMSSGKNTRVTVHASDNQNVTLYGEECAVIY